MKKLSTFTLPEAVSDSPAHRALGSQIVASWRKDGIIEVRRDEIQVQETQRALEENQKFFARPLDEKRQYIDDLTFSGHVASGEEKNRPPRIFPRYSPFSRIFR